MTNRKHIIYNAIRTPDGTLLESHSTHHYITYIDDNGEHYTVDGGREYLKRTTNKIPYEELSVYSDDSHTNIRKVYVWGSYGKAGGETLYNIPLPDMSIEHINAILENCGYIGVVSLTIFKNELMYRKCIDNGMSINEIESLLKL